MPSCPHAQAWREAAHLSEAGALTPAYTTRADERCGWLLCDEAPPRSDEHDLDGLRPQQLLIALIAFHKSQWLTTGHARTFSAGPQSQSPRALRFPAICLAHRRRYVSPFPSLRPPLHTRARTHARTHTFRGILTVHTSHLPRYSHCSHIAPPNLTSELASVIPRCWLLIDVHRLSQGRAQRSAARCEVCVVWGLPSRRSPSSGSPHRAPACFASLGLGASGLSDRSTTAGQTRVARLRAPSFSAHLKCARLPLQAPAQGTDVLESLPSLRSASLVPAAHARTLPLLSFPPACHSALSLRSLM